MSALRILAAMLTLSAAMTASACPFCSAEQKTLTEEMNDASVVLLGRLKAPSEAAQKLAESGVPSGFIDPETGAATFTVERVLKGQPLVEGVEEVQAIYFGAADAQELFFIRGVAEPPDWAIPLPLSPVAAEYVPKLLTLPETGVERMAFFQDYLEHPDQLLAQDAYDEFARAPYKDVVDLGPRMDRQQLREWIEDVRVSPSRRRLFLTMLGVCGEPQDLERIEQLLTSDARVLGPAVDAGATAAILAGGSPVFGMSGEMVRFAERQRKLGLDALIACYMTLAGKHGDPVEALDLIDERYLEDRDVDYSHVYAALQALRFLAEEQRDLVPLDRVLASARLLLDNPEFADQVIPDLSRWGDWSVLERLADMYKATFDEDNPDAPVKYVREPVISYLDVAKTQETGDVAERAEKALATIEPLDPKAVQRARSLQSFGFLAGARAKPAPATVDDPMAAATDDPAGDIAVDPPAELAEELAAQEEAAKGPSEAPGAMETAVSAPFESNAADEEAPPEGPPMAPERPAVADTEVAPAEPPSRVLLVGAPLAAAALMVGLFWLILRSGVA
ncbi:hypothetical protein [Botrimarina mediterranea]|uniref:hypothetical protein n=1 Tax=Botrimarina mediterranea TaxID=2528022 RepID=UPI00118BF7BE|nr:hypothetical protein K2D_01960 [Planctomycetes bacterium K2D]